MSRQLPDGFAELEPFAARWAAGESNDRMLRRLASTADEREAFCAAMGASVELALAHLDARPLDELDAADRRLLDLLLALPHVALAVEQQRDLEPQHARMQEEFRIERWSGQFGTPTPSGTV